MKGRNLVSNINVEIRSYSFTIHGISSIPTVLRVDIGITNCPCHGDMPNTNQRLNNISNDMKARWDTGRTVRNAANPSRPTIITGFWCECVQEYYPWVTLLTTTPIQETTNTFRRY